MSCNRGWGFGLEWSARTINNVPSFLFDKELEQVERLRAILFSSLAIRDMIEIWLVEASISTTPWGMDCFRDKILDFQKEIQELKARPGPTAIAVAKQRAVDLHIKVDRVKFILGKAQQEVNGLHWHLGDS
ncbi:hypothetical protein BHM03_00042548 [Ensete ventricosum]|nr:hypothetical protein BHM03_00042548 [Ensete ventricosum]